MPQFHPASDVARVWYWRSTLAEALDAAFLAWNYRAGMMDCKKALIKSDGDQDVAADFLRKKGLAQ